MQGQPISYLGAWGGPGISYRYPIMIPLSFALQVAGAFNAIAFDTPNFCQAENAGIQFQIQVLDENENPLNLYGATDLTIAFQAPDGTQFTRSASFLTNGMDGTIVYTTTDDDLTEAGRWDVQAQVTVGGATLTTAWGTFGVNANI